MRTIVFFLEEPSAKAMLEGILPKFLAEDVTPHYVIFEGKQDLEKRMPKRLRAWLPGDTYFVVLRDQDCGDCTAIKSALKQKCAEAGKPQTLVRIACRELEAFYLGDLRAVERALGPKNLSKQQGKRNFRNPDQLRSPSVELKRLAAHYQKLSGSRAIAPLLDIQNNRSLSFNALIAGIRKLVSEPPQ